MSWLTSKRKRHVTLWADAQPRVPGIVQAARRRDGI